MSSDSTVDFENHQYRTMMNSDDTGVMSIDQGGEWDITLFDELENLGGSDEFLKALEYAGYDTDIPNLDFDLDLTPWNQDSPCTDGEVSVDSLSPAHTLSSVSSPASVEALSPYSLSDEVLSLQSLLSPVSVCSDSSGFSEVPPPAKKAPKKNSEATRARAAQPAKRPIQFNPKVSIQPKPVVTAVPLAHAAAPLQTKFIIQTVLPLVKPAPVSIQPAPPAGKPVVLPQSGQVLQIQTPPAITSHVVNMPTLSQKRPAPIAGPPMVSVSLRTPSDDDSMVSQRQQRLIKNRESASLSRKKKKDYLLALEARLKVTLSENEALKHENGNLKKQLEGLLFENTALKSSAPKRKAVCVMVVLVFLVLNVGPMSLFQSGLSSTLSTGSAQHSGRHLLGFSPETEAGVGPEPLGSSPPQTADSSEDKALMVVKDPEFLRPPAPCQPPINRTKCMELAHELRGWVHRHEVEQTKSRRMSKGHHKPTRTILKAEDKEDDIGRIVTVQYTETSEEKNPGSELQVYYAPHRTYSDFFDEINRRGDTFYIVSFRRDHLLLPATSHNKGSRPKMSVVLPAMNTNDSIIRDEEFQVMMQIDCEVTDTRILHIRSSSIPPLLRVNRTDYQSPPPDSQPMPPVGVLMGSA
ncbi:cyclic AMP-dependent transcription factor ATF-6 alpha isoform X2 [Lampris incognitus]|uniref:cyclic AMP-dependent transcription factor ATF-6 alpha isoform X2 n=1 Tax=Lampris incognitus TaxID=2546036 RepID=UPI0024B50D0A|nr:cyclic AMP-dependent transcription factor ATF-6 alpha isoform X2 [Lampris incognitus]